MRLDVSLQQRQTLQLRLAPQMIQAIEILQLPNIDLKDRIDLELAENEVLEVDEAAAASLEPAAAETKPASDGGGDEGGDEGAEPPDGEFTQTVERLARMADEDREMGLRRRTAAGDEASDRKLEALQATAAPPPSLQDALADQLTLLDTDEKTGVLARAIIYSLDGEGFLAIHPLARPLLAATDERGNLAHPIEEVVAGLEAAGRGAVEGDGAEDGAAPAAAAEAGYGSAPYGTYGDAAFGVSVRGRGGRDPERAAAQRAARAKDKEEAREDLRREAARVAATAASLRRRMADEGRTADLDGAVLLFPLEEVLDLLASEGTEATLAEAEKALSVVQSLEPRGIAGRTAAETLLLQLRPADPFLERKRHFIRHHLEDWRKNRLPRITQAMGISMDELKELLEDMGDLNPRPGASLQREPSAYLHPDVVVEWSEEGYQVRLVNEYFPSLRISAQYLRLFEDANTDPALREMIKKKIGSARWLIDAIRQRQDTLLRVVREIVRHQKEFLDLGLVAMRPLKMQRIADDLGIHVSTVSRAIADKYAQSPQGILPLKFFFHGATESSDGSVESRLSVKDKVRQAIEAEDKSHPLSDEELAAKFQAEGLNIARRTVTKYRKQLQIPSSRERREWR